MGSDFQAGLEPARDARAEYLPLLHALAGFGMLSVGDVFTKLAAEHWPGTALAALRYVMGGLALMLLVQLRHGRSAFALPQPWIQFGRGTAVAVSTLSFYVGLQFLPLATATAVGFTTPMITALLSALLLREKIELRLWFISALAFAGVIMVLRPGVESFGPLALFPLLSATAMACLMILNRKVSDGASPLVMQMLGACCAVPLLVIAAVGLHLSGQPAFHVGPLVPLVVGCAAAVALLATIGHWLIYLATVRASAALVAPSIYVQMLFAVLLGWTVFDDVPDLQTLAGIAMIVCAGLWLFRGPFVRRRSRP